MTVAHGTGCDGETCMVTEDPSHICPITFLVEYMVVLHLSGQLWDIGQKEYGDLWIIPELKSNY